MNPKYTVVIPTRNRAYCLWKAVDSVCQQTYRDWELLVVDGNSTDDTQKLINGFNNPKVRFILNTNDTGVASARNRGIKEAGGEYIAYLDSDDFVYPRWLCEMDRYIDRYPHKVLFMSNKLYTIRQVDDDNRQIKVFLQKRLFGKPLTATNIINLEVQCDTNGMVHKASIVNDTGLWNEDLKLYEDYEFLLRILEKYPRGLGYVPRVLVNYTRTYGIDSLCNQATYRVLVDSLEKIYKIHKNNELLKNQTWYPSLIKKYREMAKEEVVVGRKIIDRIKEKYAEHDAAS